MQTCRVCGEEKPLSEFHFRNDSGKYRTNCKDCRNTVEAARRYNITVEEVQNLSKEANNRCMICDIPAEEIIHTTFKHNPLVIDHCHTTGKVRGLLCPTCNSGLGHFKDNPETLIKAAQYLYERNKR